MQWEENKAQCFLRRCNVPRARWCLPFYPCFLLQCSGPGLVPAGWTAAFVCLLVGATGCANTSAYWPTYFSC